MPLVPPLEQSSMFFCVQYVLRRHSVVVFSWSIRETIDKLPDDVLLGVFDAYRLDLQLQPRI